MLARELRRLLPVVLLKRPAYVVHHGCRLLVHVPIAASTFRVLPGVGTSSPQRLLVERYAFRRNRPHDVCTDGSVAQRN